MFSYQPDVFWLALPENPQNISITPFESEWGVTDELLCYHQNTLIGLVATKIAQPYFLGQKTTFISLLPKLDRKRNYVFPTVLEFQSAIANLLTESPIWNLRCEYDCDQYPVVEIQENLHETIKGIESALLYSAGKIQECPTFSATRGHG